MQSATDTPGGTADRQNKWVWLLAPAALFLVSAMLTQTTMLADTFNYVNETLGVHDGIAPASSLWESGHILWRPFAYLAAPLFLKLIPTSMAWTPSLQLGAGLIAVNFVCAFLCTLLIYDVSRRLMRSPLWALLPTLLFVWGDAVLAYSRSGSSYIPGLLVLVLGLWWQLTARAIQTKTIIGPACLFGMAGLLWLPYAIVIPAACAARKFIILPDATRKSMGWRQVLLSMVTSGTVLVFGIAMAALWADVQSPSGFVAWMVASSHGQHQNRQWVRAVSGCSRLFLELGTDGVYMKRFAFHDPYFPVTAASLIRHSLAKIGLFYIFIVSIVVLAWRAPVSRSTLVPLALAGLPSLFFATVVFEPSSPERFLPVLPFLLITFASSLAQSPQPLLMRAVLYLFPVLLPVMNFPSFEPNLSNGYRQALTQLTALRQRAAGGDVLIALTISEPAVLFENLHPFDPFNRDNRIRIHWTIDPRAADPARWPVRFTQMVLQQWREGHNVWVDKAGLADRPADYLLWTEGDNPELHWRDIPLFFHTLEYDANAGGADGFLRVSRLPANQERLLQLTQ